MITASFSSSLREMQRFSDPVPPASANSSGRQGRSQVWPDHFSRLVLRKSHYPASCCASCSIAMMNRRKMFRKGCRVIGDKPGLADNPGTKKGLQDAWRGKRASHTIQFFFGGEKMKWRIVCCMALAAALSTTSVYADGGALFREKCGSCHQKGGQAAPVNPADKAAVVWEKFFDRNRHATDISAILNADELQSVVGYLKQFAADSDRPETAAIPK